jgi:hypothetical protein
MTPCVGCGAPHAHVWRVDGLPILSDALTMRYAVHFELPPPETPLEWVALRFALWARVEGQTFRFERLCSLCAVWAAEVGLALTLVPEGWETWRPGPKKTLKSGRMGTDT